MDILIHPTYLPNIAHFAAIIQADNVWFEMDDNFQKQTYRNRAYIYGANGKLSLNIPVIHTQKERQKYRDVRIYNAEKWQLNHWKSLESAYRTSPFFEFYEDEIAPLYQTQVEFLLDFNMTCFETICDCLQLELPILKTDVYEKTVTNKLDWRHLVNAKQEKPKQFEPYTQVFNDKHGFISNLSILDLLFSEGPNTINYLQNQSLLEL
ncbi:WbqC family protein [Hanstruepera flava]|uniref:WbqC family protein n=1 Tax=Hanstruepera flava TaxID=2930218 RepID=UPI0020290BE5|nr:WbqC family protein [Hanstruepera flava]